jgi:DNA-binding transcriptional MocR family regulator
LAVTHATPARKLRALARPESSTRRYDQNALRPPPAKAFDRQGLVMHRSSLSKCLAPGYRVGWVAAGRIAQKIERLKLMTTLSVAVPSQQALSEYCSTAAMTGTCGSCARAWPRSR